MVDDFNREGVAIRPFSSSPPTSLSVNYGLTHHRHRCQLVDHFARHQQLSLEREKVKLEREKLVVERSKARWTALSIAVPLLVAFITLGYNSLSENIRAKVALDLQRQRNEDEFRLKAFEVLLTNPDRHIADKAR